MTLKKIVTEGTLETALVHLRDRGGQVFPGRAGSDSITWMLGSRQTIFWKPKSKRRNEIFQLATDLGYPDPELATGGGLVKYVLELAGCDYKGTYFDPHWRNIAKRGEHWHYMHCDKGKHGYVIECDIKSAYWRMFANAPSCLVAGKRTYLDDGGALINLNAIMTETPKWFRLIFLGVLASWRMQYYTRNPDTNSDDTFLLKERFQIKYGALFNATHRAIRRLHFVMSEAHEMLEDACVRIHTDGFFIKSTHFASHWLACEEFLMRCGLECGVKRAGDCWLQDINCGWIGTYPVGSRLDASDAIRSAGEKIRKRTHWEMLGVPEATVQKYRLDLSYEERKSLR